MVKNPSKLCRAEVRIEKKPCPHLNEWLESLLAKRIAVGGGSPILPDNGGIDRSPRLSIPNHDRLPLVRDPDCGDVAGVGTCFCQRLLSDSDLGAPDVQRVVLYPTRLGKELTDLFLGNRNDLPVAIKNERSAASGALVESEDVLNAAGLPGRAP